MGRAAVGPGLSLGDALVGARPHHRRGHAPLLEIETGAHSPSGPDPGRSHCLRDGAEHAPPRAPVRARATESEGEIEERLDVAERQLGAGTALPPPIVNDDLERALAELEGIVRGELELQLACPAVIHPRVDELLENVDSRYALVIVAAKRARQINNYHHQLGEGTFDQFLPPLVESRSKNYLTMALEEIARARSSTRTQALGGERKPTSAGRRLLRSSTKGRCAMSVRSGLGAVAPRWRPSPRSSRLSLRHGRRPIPTERAARPRPQAFALKLSRGRRLVGDDDLVLTFVEPLDGLPQLRLMRPPGSRTPLSVRVAVLPRAPRPPKKGGYHVPRR